MKLHRVSLEQVVRFLNSLGQSNENQSFQLIDNKGIWYAWAPPKKSTESPTETLVLHVAELEAALELIEVVIEHSDTTPSDRPDLKFHEPTQSLIATGKPEALQFI